MDGRVEDVIDGMRKKCKPNGFGLFYEDLILKASSQKQHTDLSFIFQVSKEASAKWGSLSAYTRAVYDEEASVLEPLYEEAGYKPAMEGCAKAVIAGKKRNAGNLKNRKRLAVYSQILRELSKKKKGFTSEEPKVEALNPGEAVTSEEPKVEALNPGEAVIARLRKNKPSPFGLFVEDLIKEAIFQKQLTDSLHLGQIMQESRDKWRSLSAFERACYAEQADLASEAAYVEARDRARTEDEKKASYFGGTQSCR